METLNQVQDNPQVSEDILKFINFNPIIYGLQFQDYRDGKIIYTQPDKFAISKALIDLDLFQKRQEAIDNRTKISEGDWIIRKSGEYERVSVARGGYIQAGGNGSNYISQTGFCSYSGSCGDRIEKVELTDETMEGSCWIFSGDWSGAHRGVYNFLKFKVYREL